MKWGSDDENTMLLITPYSSLSWNILIVWGFSLPLALYSRITLRLLPYSFSLVATCVRRGRKWMHSMASALSASGGLYCRRG